MQLRDLAAGHRALSLQCLHPARHVGLVLRTIPQTLPTIDTLNLPQVLKDVTLTKRGLVILSAPPVRARARRCGRWSTFATRTPSATSSTIEDPVEFVHPHKNASSRSARSASTPRLATGAEDTLRQAPDVILMGEIQRPRNDGACGGVCRTGHLCMATLHAQQRHQALDRIINFFPEERRSNC